MKTIAIAAVLMMLAAPAWADEAEKQIHDPASSNEPIVLSEAEMDGVTAGYSSYWDAGFVTLDVSDPASSSTSTRNTTSGVKLNQMWGYTFYD